MPFNGSNGTFNRLYNFTADAAQGIKILAARMDAELNGIAAGLSDCVTRDGQSPPTADLPMGGKKLVNLGTPTIATDAATKGYADGLLSGSLTLQGTTYFAGDTNFGVFKSGANPTIGFDTSDYAQYDRTNNALNLVIGGVTQMNVGIGYTNFAGTIAANAPGLGKAVLNPGDATHTGYVAFFNAANTRVGYIGFADGSNSILFNNDLGAPHVFGAPISANYGLNAASYLRRNGADVWASDNFNPNNYAAINSTPTFTWVATSSNGNGTNVKIGDDVWLGDINLTSSFGVRGVNNPNEGFISFGTNGLRLGNNANDGTLRYNGNQVWDAGSFNPNAYAALSSGPTFGGTLRAPVVQFGDPQHYACMSGPNAFYNYDANDYMYYDRNNNKYVWVVAGTAVMSLDGGGNLRLIGNVYAAQGGV